MAWYLVKYRGNFTLPYLYSERKENLHLKLWSDFHFGSHLSSVTSTTQAELHKVSQKPFVVKELVHDTEYSFRKYLHYDFR
jgi:hypothetical protein